MQRPPRYRRRELLPYPGAMRPKYYRYRKPPRLFTCPLERKHVVGLLENGAHPSCLRNGIPLFWYAAMHTADNHNGLQWLLQCGLGAEDLDRPATMPDGSKRTLFQQVTLKPCNLKHLLGRTAWRPPAATGKPTASLPSSAGTNRPSYENLTAVLLRIRARLPDPEVVEDLMGRGWPEVRALLEAMLLAGTQAAGRDTQRQRL